MNQNCQSMTLDFDRLRLHFHFSTYPGHFLLTNLLLDILKSSAPSRIIVLSSLAHKYGELNRADLNSEKSYNKFKAYSQSKLSNILFTQELARRLKGTGVTCNAIHPGRFELISKKLKEKFLFCPFLFSSFMQAL